MLCFDAPVVFVANLKCPAAYRTKDLPIDVCSLAFDSELYWVQHMQQLRNHFESFVFDFHISLISILILILIPFVQRG